MKIDLFKLVEEKNITVKEKMLSDNERGAAFRKNGKWFIILNKLDTPERKNFTIAHELAEIELYYRKDLTLDEKHRLANERASDILLPEKQFCEDVNKYNLVELKEKYQQASYEVIARKSLKYKNRILTIIDNGLIKLRKASDGFVLQQDIFPFEKKVIGECYNKKENIIREDHQMRCEAYFIDEGRGVERVILFTEEII